VCRLDASRGQALSVRVRIEPWILVVSGSSSSGKSTLCRSVMPLLPVPSVLVEADRAFPSPSGWPKDGSFQPPIVVFHRSVRTWWEAGVSVVLDGSLPYGNEDLRQQCLGQLPPGRTFTLAVSCCVEELRRREGVRPDSRPAGWAERQAADINVGLTPIVTIDTSDGRTDVHAREVVAALGTEGLL
jgi:chloramphenicol 3-O phosphotransferase